MSKGLGWGVGAWGFRVYGLEGGDFGGFMTGFWAFGVQASSE